MENFEFLFPHSLSEALELYDQHRDADTAYVAGGTDMIPPLRKGAMHVDYLIDLAGLGLDRITVSDGAIHIGALCTMKQLYSSPEIAAVLPALASAAESVGCVQTRGLATIGGNLCAALPSADGAPALYTYNARVVAQSSGGKREIPMEEFFTGPRKTSLLPGDIITEIVVPRPGPAFKAAFTKFGRRGALTLSIVNCSLGAAVEDHRLRDVRGCIGACAPTPRSMVDACAYLEGKSYEEIEPDHVAALVAEGLSPISDIRASKEYRSELAGILFFRQVKWLFGLRGSVDGMEGDDI